MSETTTSSPPAQPRSNVWGCALIAGATLLAGLSWLLSVNEYADMFGREMAQAYDCNGPDTVLVVSLAAFVVAAAGLVVSARALRARRGIAAAAALCLGVLVIGALAARAPAIASELKKNAAPDSPCR